MGTYGKFFLLICFLVFLVHGKHHFHNKYKLKDYIKKIKLHDDEVRFDNFLRSFRLFEKRKAISQLPDTCDVKQQYMFTTNDFRVTILTIERMVDFMLSNKDNIIVDGLFGIRISEGTLKDVASKLDKNDKYLPIMKRLIKKLSMSAHLIYKNLLKNATEYTKMFVPIIDRPMTYAIDWHNYDPELVWDNTKDLEIDEQKSDNCITMLLGSNPNIEGKCHVTDQCSEQSTKPNLKGYFLTHQLLYFLAGETHGCHAKFVELIGSPSNLTHLYRTFANNIYSQMGEKKVSEMENQDADLYFEQGFICAQYGIVECINFNRLKEGLKMVGNNGCIEANKEDDLEKREDKLIGKCSQHITSVAMGYLAQHVRFMIDTPDCSIVENDV